MIREIVLDTETTGLDPDSGHRVVEVGAVELVNHVPTGQTFHSYIHPERDMPEEAFRVHGLRAEFLAGYPVFAEVVDAFLEFVGDSKVVIHNAAFDLKFINAELRRLERDPWPAERAVDTLYLAQRRFPGLAQQPGRAVQALRRRRLGPDEARSTPRQRASGRGLPPPPGRPANGSGPGPARPARGRPGSDFAPDPPAAPLRALRSRASRPMQLSSPGSGIRCGSPEVATRGRLAASRRLR